MTRYLCVHWRLRHVNRERLDAIREVLAQHPGDDDVRVQFTSGERIRLGVTVDGASPELRRALHYASGCTAMAHVVNPAAMWN